MVGPRALQRRGSRRRGRTRGRRLHSVRITCFVLDAARADVPTPPPHARCCPWWRGRARRNCSSRRARGYCGPTAPSPPSSCSRPSGARPPRVVVLPNGALPAQDLIAVGARARADARDVVFLPSSSMVQALAALAVHDADGGGRRRVRDVGSGGGHPLGFASGRGGTRPHLRRDVRTGGRTGPRRARGRGESNGTSWPPDAGRRPRSGGGGELVTVLLGAQASEGLGSGSRTTSRPAIRGSR